MRSEDPFDPAPEGRGRGAVPGARGSATSYPKAARPRPGRGRNAPRPGDARRSPRPPSSPLGRSAGAACLALAGAAAGCAATPVTGKQAFNLFPVSQDAALGAEAYQQILAEADAPRVTSGPENAMVERVMRRLVAVADDPGFEWEVTLLQADDTVNAFALPGGKMAVYTGILPVAGSEEGLAVVMGHEIGHVVARHGTQRMTQAMGVEVVFSLLEVGDYETLARELVGLTLSLPFSRAHESEADHIGLVYMARAGYDPRAAVGFWERMAEAGGGSPPEFLSTHPSHETRIRQIQELLPEAVEIYRSSGGAAGAP